ncbi:hypothetical protein ETH_00019170, partial [Eimeria tenella]
VFIAGIAGEDGEGLDLRSNSARV